MIRMHSNTFHNVFGVYELYERNQQLPEYVEHLIKCTWTYYILFLHAHKPLTENAWVCSCWRTNALLLLIVALKHEQLYNDNGNLQ